MSRMPPSFSGGLLWAYAPPAASASPNANTPDTTRLMNASLSTRRIWLRALVDAAIMPHALATGKQAAARKSVREQVRPNASCARFPQSGMNHRLLLCSDGHALRRIVEISPGPNPARASFDHLIGAGKQRRWYFDPECFGALCIDDKFKFCRLQHWQIGGPDPAQDFACVHPCLPESVNQIDTVAHETASLGELPPFVDRRDCMMRRQRNQLITPAQEKRVGADQQHGSLALGHCG